MSQTRVMHAILNQPQDCAAGHGALGTFEILPYYLLHFISLKLRHFYIYDLPPSLAADAKWHG